MTMPLGSCQILELVNWKLALVLIDRQETKLLILVESIVYQLRDTLKAKNADIFDLHISYAEWNTITPPVFAKIYEVYSII